MTALSSERMHHLNGPQSGGKSKVNNSRKTSRKKEEVIPQPPPPNVTMEQFTPSIRVRSTTKTNFTRYPFYLG